MDCRLAAWGSRVACRCAAFGPVFYFLKGFLALGGVALERAPAYKLEGRQFESQPWLGPGLPRSWLGVCERQPIDVSLAH